MYEPLENSLHALDSDSSLLLQLLRGYSGAGAVRLSWLRHLPTGRPGFPLGSCQTDRDASQSGIKRSGLG